MRILVTGAGGFIGSHIALALETEGHEVIAISTYSTDIETVLPRFSGKIHFAGILGVDLNAIGPIDAVFHQAAISDTQLMDEHEIYKANVETSKAVFEYAAQAGARHIIYASSTAVYGNAPVPFIETMSPTPTNPYARSKVALELYAEEFSKQHPEISVIGLRYSNVYGPMESLKHKRATMIYQLAAQMKVGNPKLFALGEQRRDYVYIEDVMSANLVALRSEAVGVFNCGSGESVSFNELVAKLNSLLSLSREVEYIENPYQDNYQSHTLCDMTKSEAELGFRPRFDINAGLKKYYESGWLA